jgi:hypothetical protein
MNRPELYEQARRAIDQWHRTRDKQSLDAAVQRYRDIMALPWNGSEIPAPGQCVREMTTALTEGSEAELPGYTDDAINVATQLLARVDTVPELWTARGYNRMLRYARLNNLDDVNGAVTDFKQAVAHTAADDAQIYLRTLNVAWASEARFDRLKAVGEKYRAIEVGGVERWRGPRDLVLPIWMIESLLAPDNGHPPAPAEVLPRLKRNLANLLTRYALHVELRPQQERAHDFQRAVALLQEGMVETKPGSFDHDTIAGSLVATVEQGRAAGLLAAP